MKILVIPDIHGSNHWKKNYLDNIDKVDKCVFLGDYVDSFNEEEKGINAVKNFEDIFNTVDLNKTDILLGNHDLSYCKFAKGSSHVSGHQLEMSTEYNNVIEKYSDKIKIAVEYDNWVFSHAGFTNTWFKNSVSYYNVLNKENKKEFNNPIEFSNYLWKNKNGIFFNFDHACLDPYGDDIMQGPLWIRPMSLLYDSYYKKQIVGHTEVDNPPKVLRNSKSETTVIVVDSREHNSFFIIDTEKEYI